VKVGLYLMTRKAIPVLNTAIESGVEIVQVTTDAAVGMRDAAHKEIAAIAKASGIPTFTRSHPPEFVADYSIAAGWRWMLDVPGYLVVLHDSLLPRYRGFSPMITALVNGEREIGVTAFLAGPPGEGYDTGPIIEQRRIEIDHPTRAEVAISRLTRLYGEIAEDIFAAFRVQEQLCYVNQDEREATYSIWRDEQDFRIDWTKDDRSILRLIDAASFPFVGAWTIAFGQSLIIERAELAPDVRFEQRHPGKIHTLDPAPTVVCGQGMLRITDSEPTIKTLRLRLC
jgi:methionyl-tRNA formyltransferase